ncbi:PHP domain-containing protein [Aquipuribacter hungaricus]|uniref:PHP domain-containing protein n=2 Tax=Aquipuribacter hungaricus TaxID=545624 RepID=A0ABV7WK99_9MICO
MTGTHGSPHAHPHAHDEHHAQDHAHGQDHGHTHAETVLDETTAVAVDTSVPDRELSPAQLSRRTMLRAAGIVGAVGAAGLGTAGTALPAAAAPGGASRSPGQPVRRWLAGDHHIHTQYSSDGLYTVADQAQHGRAYGLDWLVITDHGSNEHVRVGVEKVNPDIVAAREDLPGTLIFQGLEWNIPSAEHGTVFVTPGPDEVAVLKQFEQGYDGRANPTTADEALAVAGVQWLGQQVDARRVESALFFANHPARQGIDSPHEIRAWRDADPRVAVGFEGAPGHQAAGLPDGAASGRGYYDNAGTNPARFVPYPPESYRTWGGFDWMTATVGGLWDSLLAEGKPWWITVNSDSHSNYLATSTRGPGSDFARDGFYQDPVYSGGPNLTAGDFWPGQYGRTNVGVDRAGYGQVMQGLRDGRVWVDHGRLVKGVEMVVRRAGGRGPAFPLGSQVVVPRGTRLELSIRLTLQDLPNWADFVPVLNRVDLVQGSIDVAGPADRDTFLAPDTKVVRSWDTSGTTGTIELVQPLGAVEAPFYVRARGTDANRSQPGYLGAALDPEGPAIDVVGDADPWLDLWFYTNPIFVLPA